MDHAAALARVELELARIGLLLQHDRELPSATALIAGAPVAGSWWGHALGHDLYEVLTLLEHGAGKLSAKLVNGKITYVHARLWPAFLALVEADVQRRSRDLSAGARQLFAHVSEHGTVRSDELCRSGFASSRELTAASRELDLRLLVKVDGLHTDSGAHTKILRSWRSFASAHALDGGRIPREDARRELREAVSLLARAPRRAVQVPLLDTQS